MQQYRRLRASIAADTLLPFFAWVIGRD